MNIKRKYIYPANYDSHNSHRNMKQNTSRDSTLWFMRIFFLNIIKTLWGLLKASFINTEGTIIKQAGTEVSGFKKSNLTSDNQFWNKISLRVATSTSNSSSPPNCIFNCSVIEGGATSDQGGVKTHFRNKSSKTCFQAKNNKWRDVFCVLTNYLLSRYYCGICDLISWLLCLYCWAVTLLFVSITAVARGEKSCVRVWEVSNRRCHWEKWIQVNWGCVTEWNWKSKNKKSRLSLIQCCCINWSVIVGFLPNTCKKNIVEFWDCALNQPCSALPLNLLTFFACWYINVQVEWEFTLIY